MFFGREMTAYSNKGRWYLMRMEWVNGEAGAIIYASPNIWQPAPGDRTASICSGGRGVEPYITDGGTVMTGKMIHRFQPLQAGNFQPAPGDRTALICFGWMVRADYAKSIGIAE